MFFRSFAALPSRSKLRYLIDFAFVGSKRRYWIDFAFVGVPLVWAQCSNVFWLVPLSLTTTMSVNAWALGLSMYLLFLRSTALVFLQTIFVRRARSDGNPFCLLHHSLIIFGSWLPSFATLLLERRVDHRTTVLVRTLRRILFPCCSIHQSLFGSWLCCLPTIIAVKRHLGLRLVMLDGFGHIPSTSPFCIAANARVQLWIHVSAMAILLTCVAYKDRSFRRPASWFAVSWSYFRFGWF